MNPYSSLSDDFFVNVNLGTEMELPANRETILHFYERLQKTYPTMRNFYSRDRGDFVLEEDKDKGSYRWCSIEPRRLCSGYVNPETVQVAMEQHRLILELAPYMLSVSPLDCEALDLLFEQGRPFNLMLRKAGLDPEKDIKLVEVGFALSEDALRSGRVDAVNMNQPFAARAEAKGGVRKLFALSEALPNIVHILEACRKDFVEKNPELVTAYVKDITAAMKMALADRNETMKVVSEVMKAPIPVLDTYLLKPNDFAREPGAAPNFAGIQAMFDVYTDNKMLPKKLDASVLKHPKIVAPME